MDSKLSKAVALVAATLALTACSSYVVTPAGDVVATPGYALTPQGYVAPPESYVVTPQGYVAAPSPGWGFAAPVTQTPDKIEGNQGPAVQGPTP